MGPRSRMTPARLRPDATAPRSRVGVSHGAQGVLNLQTTAGNRAVARAAAGTLALPLPLQRIMPEARWLTESALASDTRSVMKTKRKNVLPIDVQVAAYKAAGDYHGDRPAIADAKHAVLPKIIAACTSYLGIKGGKRMAAVRTLKVQAEAEKDCLDRVIAARDEVDFKLRMDGLLAAHELALAKDAQGLFVGGPANYAKELISATVRKHDQADRPTLEAFVKADLARLKAVQEDPKAPAIVSAVIAEALEHIDKIHLGDFDSAGARVATDKDKAAGVTHKYVLNHKMGAVLGTSERVASLMHELTHIVAGESYQNTLLLLLFDQNAPPDAVVALAKQRAAVLKKILDLSGDARDRRAVTGDQFLLLKDKVEYGGAGASGDKLGKYLESFASQLPQEKHAELAAIKKQIEGFSSTVVEYDSVINQVLLLVYEWKLPLDDELYAYVRDRASEAKDLRDAQRQRMLASAAKAAKTD